MAAASTDTHVAGVRIREQIGRCIGLLALGWTTGAAGQPQPVDDGFNNRFPQSDETAESDAPAQRPPDAGAATVAPVDTAACATLEPSERLSCPLIGDDVVHTAPLPAGVRLVLLRGRHSPQRIHAILSCHRMLQAVRPRASPPCPFLTDAVVFEVTQRRGRVLVDLTVTGDRIGPGVLREQVATALGARERGQVGKPGQRKKP